MSVVRLPSYMTFLALFAKWIPWRLLFWFFGISIDYMELPYISWLEDGLWDLLIQQQWYPEYILLHVPSGNEGMPSIPEAGKGLVSQPHGCVLDSDYPLLQLHAWQRHGWGIIITGKIEQAIFSYWESTSSSLISRHKNVWNTSYRVIVSKIEWYRCFELWNVSVWLEQNKKIFQQS